MDVILKWSKKVLFIALLFPQLLFAQEKIWIKAPQMPLSEFKAHVSALGSSHISYSQNLLKEKREQAKSFKLKDKLLKAQEFYLSGEEEKAMKAFQKIAELALQADWDKEDQRIILYSFLRMAQSEEDSEKRKALLLSASGFALFPINSKNYPDYGLFPPPLMEDLKNIQEKTNTLLVDWKLIFPNHEIILINGQQIEKDKKINLPQTFYRILALSSSHQVWSKSLNLSELITQKIKTNSLTKGFCNNLQIREEYRKQKNTKILAFSKCPKPPVVLRLDKKNELKTTVPEPVEETWLSDLPTWLIVGAGVISLSLLIALSQTKDNKNSGGNYVY